MTTVIKRDSFDIRAFKHLSSVTPDLSQASAKSGDEFTSDIFSSLFKLAPTVDASSNASHKPIIESMMGTSDWAKFRETTRLNDVASALATVELATKLAPELQRKQDEDKLRQSIRAAIRSTAESVGEQMEAYGSLAGTGEGDGAKSDPATVSALFSKLKDSKMLRDIAKLAGRMRRIAMRKHTDRVRHGPDELTDIELGNDVGRILPAELALLDGPMEDEFYRKYAEGALLQYRLEGRETKGKGPIILCLDSSSSMRTAQRWGGMSPEVWSKAMALGLMTIASVERRDFTLIHFADGYSVRRVDFGRNPPAEKIMAEMEYFFNGGTDFNTPIATAIQAATESKYREADIIFLTDGQATIYPETEEALASAKRATGLKFYSVVIGTHSDTLNRVSEGVSRITDLSKDADTLDLVFSV